MSASHNSTVYEKINNLRPGEQASFFGRVVSYKPPRRTGGTDYILSLVVVDDSFAGNADITSPMPAGLSVNIFRRELDAFPRVERVGDIIAFRRMRIQNHKDCLQALSSNYSGWTVFRKNGPTSWAVIPLRPDELITDQQWATLNAINDLPIGKGGPAPGLSAGLVSSSSEFANRKSLKRPTLLVSDLTGGSRFFDIYLKLVEISGEFDDKFVLCCTDYTQNELLKPNFFGLNGCLERSLIKVTLWDENAAFIRRSRPAPGSVLFLENVMAKVARQQDGTSFLEAVQHGDQDGKPKVRILEDNEVAVKKINQRADQVASLSGFDASQLSKIVSASSASVSTASVGIAVPQSPIKQSPIKQGPTKQSPIKSPIRYRQLTEDPTSTLQPTSATTTHPTPAPLTPVLSAAQIPRQMATAYTTQIDDSGIKISSILEVRSYPSEHAKFCVRARVSSVFPERKWSFVRVQCSGCGQFTQLDDFSSQSLQCSHCPALDSCNRWIFVFGLMLDDGECDLPVIVAAEDAEHFLGFSAAQFGVEEGLEGLLQRVVKQISSLAGEGEHLFCLQSYRVAEDDSTTAIRYRILQTRMQSK